MLSSRSWKGTVYWRKIRQIKDRFPLLRPSCLSPWGAASYSHNGVNQLLRSIVR